MKKILVFHLLLFISMNVFSQSDIEKDCLNKIIIQSKGTVFSRWNKILTTYKDTVHFGKILVVVRNVDRQMSYAFRYGLLFPDLISGFDKHPEKRIKNKKVNQSGTIVIMDLKMIREEDNKKCFAFLLNKKGFSKPLKYIFELTNDRVGYPNILSEFIRYSRLTAFGLCSARP